MSRPNAHAEKALLHRIKSHKASWILRLQSSGLTYRIEILEELATKEELPIAEKEWISEARRQGVDLTNLTDGGDGGLNPSKETREKMALAKLGRKRSLDSCKKQGDTHRGLKRTEQTRANISAANTGRVFDEATLKKKSESMKRFWSAKKEATKA